VKSAMALCVVLTAGIAIANFGEAAPTERSTFIHGR